MAEPDLLSVCNIAYLTVFLVLGVLAAIIYLITIVLPERQERTDAAVVAAITSTIASVLPHSQVTKIEEES